MRQLDADEIDVLAEEEAEQARRVLEYRQVEIRAADQRLENGPITAITS
jgi:hypothetical protein